MTLNEFKELNKKKRVPRFDIGQGFGYKVSGYESWEVLPEDDVIYIPEYAYSEDGGLDGCFVWSESDAYTKESFRDAVRSFIPKGCNVDNEKIDGIACYVFDCVDWQYPESFIKADLNNLEELLLDEIREGDTDA